MIVLFSAAGEVRSQTYTAYVAPPLASVAGHDSSALYGIDDAGRAVGSSYAANGSRVSWTLVFNISGATATGGVLADCLPYGGGSFVSISPNGTVGGSLSDNCGGFSRGVIANVATPGSLTIYSPQPGGGDCSVYGVNNGGVGVGYSNLAQGCQSPLCIITTARPMVYGPGQGAGQELSRGGYIIGRAFGINSSGAVCGELYNTLTSGDTVAVKWPTVSSQPLVLATLGGANGDTWRISDDGSVYGWSMTSAGEHHATAWSPSGTPSDLGTLPGAVSSDAQDGRPGVGIVGYCTFGSGPSAVNKGVLFQNGSAVDLTPRVSAVVGANSVNIRAAYAINARGWIAASGTVDGTESARGVILVPCPTVLVAPTLVVTCPGGGLSVSVQGAEAATALRWRRSGQPLSDGTFDGVTISGSATATLTLSGLHAADAGLFDCVATTPCGQTTSAPTRLLVGPADLGSAGGVAGADGHYDNNDFIVFITDFFAQDFHADLGMSGGVVGSDGAFDNNDFISFINLFFTGC